MNGACCCANQTTARWRRAICPTEFSISHGKRFRKGDSDRLLLRDGRWLPVEDLLDTGEYETVYNLRVADFHTYFIGGPDWGFSVWAHNHCNPWDQFRAVMGDRGFSIDEISQAYQAAKTNDWNLYQKTVAGRGLASDVVQRGYKIGNGVAAEAQAELQEVVAGVRQAVSKDVSLAGDVLSLNEQMALLNAKGASQARLRVATYGKVIERLARDEILLNPDLDTRFAHVGGSYKPDFIGKGPYAGLNFDITTEPAVAAHLERPVYGPGLQIATYDTAPKKWS